MAHRDFAARRGVGSKKKKKGINKNALIGLVIVVLAAFAGGLFWLKSNAPAPQPAAPQAEVKQAPKSVLPNRPEEVWSYIKALETRTVPVDDNPNSVEKNMRLTEEQRQVLLQMEKDQKAAEEAKKQAEQQRADEAAKAQADALAQQQAKADAKKAEQARLDAAKKADTAKKTDAGKVETAKAVDNSKPADTGASNGGKKFGLQCGAFKNRAQAENMQGRLVMAGLNAQVMVNGDWNRVRIAGFADRDAAVQAQAKAKSVADCVVIGM